MTFSIWKQTNDTYCDLVCRWVHAVVVSVETAEFTEHTGALTTLVDSLLRVGYGV